MPIQLLAIGTAAHGVRNRHREQRVGFLTDRMNMGDGGVLARPFCHMIQVIVGAEDAQRTNPHQRAVRLAVGIVTTLQTAGDRVAAVEGPGFEPVKVGSPGCFAIIASLLDQGARQHQGHLRIVSRLAGDRIPSAAVGEFADAIGVRPPNLLRGLKLYQAAQRVTGKLAEQAALRPIPGLLERASPESS